MGVFKETFQKIGSALADASSLDVVTFRGSVETIASGAELPENFQQVIALASQNTQVKVKLLASTQTKIDGDILAYFDEDITESEMAAHAKLLELGQQNRAAAMDFVRRVVGLPDIDRSTGVG